MQRRDLQTRAAIDDNLWKSVVPGACIALAGSSGCGKTRLLRAIAHRLERNKHASAHLANPVSGQRSGSVLSYVCKSLPSSVTLNDVLDLLHAAGLAEGPMLLGPARLLSEGQRWRLMLASAFSRCKRGDVLLCDEWCAPLDARTANAVGMTAARWCARNRITLIVAGPRTQDLNTQLWRIWSVERDRWN